MISEVSRKRLVVRLVIVAVVALYALTPFTAGQSAAVPVAPVASASPQSLDFEFFKTRVEPIFLKRRSENHARCYACHGFSGLPGAGGSGSPPQYLVKLSPGSSFWTEEQSRIIFERVSKLVVSGNPAASRLLMYPLAPEAGGSADPLHTGGRQFESQNDPDWQTILEWVRGQKGSSSAP